MFSHIHCELLKYCPVCQTESWFSEVYGSVSDICDKCTDTTKYYEVFSGEPIQEMIGDK